MTARVHFAPRATRPRSWWVANFGPIADHRHHYDLYKAAAPALADAVDAALEEDTDLVICFELQSALPVLAARGPLPPIALDLNDIMHLAVGRMLDRGMRNRVERLYQPALARGERRAIERSASVFVCSQAAKDYLAAFAPRARIEIAANAVAFPKTEATPLDGQSTTLLFVGMFAYGPNLEAAEWLVREIFPRVLAQVPEARLALVGGYIEKLDHLRAASRHVDFLGFVPDIAAAYARSAVACSPILAGGGTRTKIIEAAAYRVPIVSTTLGAEGLDFVDGREILLRDDAAGFADACIALLRDPARGRALAEAAFLSGRIYDRERVIPEIAAALERTAAVRV